MNWTAVLDTASAVCLLLGAVLTFTAALALLRFPDVLTRMHAATKPQVLGLVLLLLGVGLKLRNPSDIETLLLVGLFQLVTTPVAAHMIARAAYRRGQIREDLLVADELAADDAAADGPADDGPPADGPAAGNAPADDRT